MHALWIILHLIGVAFGAGGAFVSDALFFSALEDKRLSQTELRFLKLASTLVWIGVGILLVSGAGLFWEDKTRYLASSKFLVKMTIVLVIIVNGLVFHYRHMPLMQSANGGDVRRTARFRAKSPLLFVSGAVSAVSWLSALILGALRSIPLSYGEGMALYLGVVVVGSLCALVLRKKILAVR